MTRAELRRRALEQATSTVQRRRGSGPRVSSIVGADTVELIVNGATGCKLGTVTTLADPFSERVERDVEWLCDQTGAVAGDVWREIWLAFVRLAAA